jgi:hypothetical protein
VKVKTQDSDPEFVKLIQFMSECILLALLPGREPGCVEVDCFLGARDSLRVASAKSQMEAYLHTMEMGPPHFWAFEGVLAAWAEVGEQMDSFLEPPPGPLLLVIMLHGKLSAPAKEDAVQLFRLMDSDLEDKVTFAAAFSPKASAKLLRGMLERGLSSEWDIRRGFSHLERKLLSWVESMGRGEVLKCQAKR